MSVIDKNNKISNSLDMVKMGEYIAKLRKKKGYTQKQLGEILDVSDKTISKWELGFVAPDITILNSLAIALDTTIEEILCGDDIPDELKNEYYRKKDPETEQQLKKKHYIRLAIIILALGIITMFSFLLRSYYKWKLFYIKTETESIDVLGFIVQNRNKSKLVIDKLVYRANFRGTDDEPIITYVKISIVDKNREIFVSDSYNLDSSKTLSDIFSDYYIIEDNDYEIDIQSLELKVEYTDINAKSKHFVIDLY